MCRLALALGKTLSEIATMPLSEFTTWMAYYQLEPFGCPADDSRAQAQMSLFFSANAKPGTPVPNFFERWQRDDTPTKQGNQEVLHAKIKGFFDPKVEKAKRKKARAAKEKINTDTPANKENRT